jgi:hypothetical protein
MGKMWKKKKVAACMQPSLLAYKFGTKSDMKLKTREVDRMLNILHVNK